MKKLLSAAAIVGQWTLLILSLRHRWAWNVFVFLMWTSTIFAVSAALQVAKDKKPLGKRSLGNTLPAVSDIGVALICAALGHFGYATLAIIQMVFELAAFTSWEKVQP